MIAGFHEQLTHQNLHLYTACLLAFSQTNTQKKVGVHVKSECSSNELREI
jgi:hypothetical protein